MNATEEWLRYIEDNAIRSQYGVFKYDDDLKDDSEDSKESELTKDTDDV